MHVAYISRIRSFRDIDWQFPTPLKRSEPAKKVCSGLHVRCGGKPPEYRTSPITELFAIREVGDGTVTDTNGHLEQ
jgi:hypothetical protein